MNCEKCQEQLSDFLDGTLGHAEHASVSAHLVACQECADAREEFNAILAAARDAHEYLYAPADERALVRRGVEVFVRVARGGEDCVELFARVGALLAGG